MRKLLALLMALGISVSLGATMGCDDSPGEKVQEGVDDAGRAVEDATD